MSLNTSLDGFVAYKIVKNGGFISNRYPLVHQRGIHMDTPTIAIDENATLGICVRLKFKNHLNISSRGLPELAQNEIIYMNKNGKN